MFALGFTLNGVHVHTGPSQEIRTITNAGIPVATDSSTAATNGTSGAHRAQRLRHPHRILVVAGGHLA